MMKKTLSIVLVGICGIALCLGLFGCGTSSNTSSNSSSSSTSASKSTSTDYISSVTADDPYGSGTHHALVKVKGYGSFTIELDADEAPVTVSNFCSLAKKGFYDGLTFHRVVEGFCLQGGDPNGTGTGGSDKDILGEFSSNNVDNKLADNFKKGTVAMARSSEANSASSQFFITLASSSSVAASLDGQYAAFGTIDSAGMKVVANIVKDAAKYADASTGTISSASKQPVITSIKITD